MAQINQASSQYGAVRVQAIPAATAAITHQIQAQDSPLKPLSLTVAIVNVSTADFTVPLAASVMLLVVGSLLDVASLSLTASPFGAFSAASLGGSVDQILFTHTLIGPGIWHFRFSEDMNNGLIVPPGKILVAAVSKALDKAGLDVAGFNAQITLDGMTVSQAGQTLYGADPRALRSR